MSKLTGTGPWAVARVVIFGLLSATILLMTFGVRLRWPLAADVGSTTIDAPAPAEFLYLDPQRAQSYLAQMQGGITTSEEQSHSVTSNITSELALQGLLHAGASSESQEAAQRVVTPTAASSYIELANSLKADGDLVTVANIARFGAFRQEVEEGQFVLFTAQSMRTPTYTDPYLAVRQSEALNALFPVAGTSAQRQRALAIRRAAHSFVERVGKNPRIVFDLRPAGEGNAAVQYLLPVQYSGLSHERSLLKNGGGQFKVLGKVVRIFPESEEEKKALREGQPLRRLAYLDQADRDTWSEPLRHADPELICRAEPQCARQVNDEPGSREEALEGVRRGLETGLSTQTQIHDRGAVILPVAIYK